MGYGFEAERGLEQGFVTELNVGQLYNSSCMESR